MVPRLVLRGRGIAVVAGTLLALLTAPASALDPKATFNHYRLDH